MEETSAVSLLQQILDAALADKCSDVHLHLVNGQLDVYFRTGGRLVLHQSVQEIGGLVLRRVKALARMDVSDMRFPQDGSFVFASHQVDCDVRAAAIKTIQGESMVLRLLPRHENFQLFNELGMSDQEALQIDTILTQRSGLVLVAGSTGSGKTTTLYTMMHRLAGWGRNVVSIEDPVEIAISSCRQMEVRERLGVTFDMGLKALLRQDPDVIMIGEIRDEETARVALRAALSGHLVLSTTHARDLVGAAARLVDFGLSRALLGDVLRAVVVQELLEVGCPKCQGTGCPICSESGFTGERTARFSIEIMDAHTTALLASGLSWGQLRKGLKANKSSLGRSHHET